MFEMRSHNMELLTSVKETVIGDDTGAGEDDTNGRDRLAAAESVSEAQPATSYASEADFVVATGRTRSEALLELVEAHEGRVKQAELVEFTGWSKTMVSRLLSELERDGAINRVQIGRCKVVLLPDEPLVGEHAVSYDTHRELCVRENQPWVTHRV